MFSIVELATAMPKAGGLYYFLDRALGPLAGTVGGIGIWLAFVLKVAFSLVGMGIYVELIIPDAPVEMIAAGLAIAIGVLNIYGTKATGSFQVVLVVGLLLILAAFIFRGMPEIERSRFGNFFGAGIDPLLAATGLVYISYGGVSKVASVAEEVSDPERNLPLGVFLALGTVLVVYFLVMVVLVGVVPMEELAVDLSPIATAAETLVGRPGVYAVTLAALLAFFSVSNAGIMSASRYPLAMARDHLVPRRLGTVTKRGTPSTALALTVAVILLIILVFDPVKIAKLASAFQLLMFALLCAAVIVMRESRIQSYDPGFKSPFYPWTQIVGIIAPFWLIFEMGWLAFGFSTGLIVAGIAWYHYYARRHVRRTGAIYHVFERLGRQRFEELDRELRGIMKEKGLRAGDPFDEVVAHAAVVDVRTETDFETVVGQASRLLAEHLPVAAPELEAGFQQGTRIGATPVTGGVALPHLRLAGIDEPSLVVVRSQRAVRVPVGDALGGAHDQPDSHALFFLVSPEDDPGQHLRLLAQLATRVDREGFIEEWLDAADADQLKLVLLRSDRYLTLRLVPGTAAGELGGKLIRDLGLPTGCLVAIIRRRGEPVVPQGGTLLAEDDTLTVIGTPEAIGAVREAYVEEPGSLGEGGDSGGG